MFLEAIALRLEAITNNKKLLGEACWIGDGLWDLATRLNGFPFLLLLRRAQKRMTANLLFVELSRFSGLLSKNQGPHVRSAGQATV